MAPIYKKLLYSKFHCDLLPSVVNKLKIQVDGKCIYIYIYILCALQLWNTMFLFKDYHGETFRMKALL